MIFVKCARGDFFERNWIRQYARKMADQSESSYEYDLIFLLGNGQTLIEEIEKEAQREDDILIGGFIDNYENLPIKTYLGFQYFAEVGPVSDLVDNEFHFQFCAGKEIVIFQDSDAFVMIDKVVNDYRKQNDLVGDTRSRSHKLILFLSLLRLNTWKSFEVLTFWTECDHFKDHGFKQSFKVLLFIVLKVLLVKK